MPNFPPKVKPLRQFPSVLRSDPTARYIEARSTPQGWRLTLFSDGTSELINIVDSRAAAARIMREWADAHGVPGMFAG